MTKAPYEVALQLLAARRLTRHELIDGLLRRGATEAEAVTTADRLGEQGYVDDAALVRDFMMDAAWHKHWGPRKIRWELQRRGVPGAVVDQIWGEMDPQITWSDVAERVAERYDRRDLKQRARCARALQRAGFAGATIHRVLGNDPEETP